jgi:hypothetical protein
MIARRTESSWCAVTPRMAATATAAKTWSDRLTDGIPMRRKAVRLFLIARPRSLGQFKPGSRRIAMSRQCAERWLVAAWGGVAILHFPCCVRGWNGTEESGW